MTALLTDNLPLLAGAPNGIKKLRELILELAVRGKLLEQSSSDEPASELLKNIAKEKALLIENKTLRKGKPLPNIEQDEMQFKLPVGWEWVRLGQIGDWGAGATPARGNSSYYGGEMPWFKSGELVADFISDSEESVTELALKDCSLRRNKPGDILIAMYGATIGKTAILSVEGTTNQAVCACTPFSGVFNRYLLLTLKALKSNFIGQGAGGAQPNISREKIVATVTGLPSLAEQHRIVAKVDELMALCDRLEAQQADAKSAHAQLVKALLESLTQASDATDFAANWQRLAEHFHTLFTTEPSIDALKEALLQLAVMGKLVPQDLSDEPASKLLKRIAEEKMRLVAAGKIRNQKQQAEIGDTEKSFELPVGWVWQRFADCALDVSTGPFGSLIHKSDYVDGGVPLINPSHMIDGLIVADHAVSLSPEMAATLDSYRLNAGDMVMARRGEVGRVALVTDTEDGWLCGTGSFVLRFTQEVSRAYILTLFKCNSVRAYLAGAAVGTTMVNLNHGILLKMPTAVPPLAEQHRIVAKLDQLIGLCGQLKARLNKARQLKLQLTSTLVEHALANGALQAPVARDQKASRTLLAAEVTHRLHAQRTFGQRKLQKVVYLAEHAARLAAIQGSYLRNVAGPHDRNLMNQVETELQKHQWYERVERETVGHAYRPLSQAGQHRQAYNRTWSAKEQANIEQVIELMRDWDTDRCEMTVTLYAAWNDFIIEGRPVTDEAIVDEVMHRWNEAKLRFSKREWLAVLTEMKKHGLLTPTGFGKRTSGGTLNLPGFE
ncbi:restriction endonuclease subunit S [Pseudomonas sp. FH1]|uniref:restriction endonuclease subunit S n=1 Tax=Pseudomonas sp. FH1 TaxID=1284392 RepID=UPI0003DDC993|nr:restriction endonuclease subunit S [Pseudomonas sp. FH1]ETK24093.1 restriction modification system DNA specificity domain-containing protein [Pseudomonas sp. FH1]